MDTDKFFWDLLTAAKHLSGRDYRMRHRGAGVKVKSGDTGGV